MPAPPIGNGYRVVAGDFLGIIAFSHMSGTIVNGQARVLYDDGDDEEFKLPATSLNLGTNPIRSDTRIRKNGWIVEFFVWYAGTTPVAHAVYVQMFVFRGEDIDNARVFQILGGGHLSVFEAPTLGKFEERDWTNWVFQGTVLEDATAGTHVSTLTIVPGAGNELEILYGEVIVGNTATAQTATGLVDDGTNELVAFLNPAAQSTTTASLKFTYPSGGEVTAAPTLTYSQPNVSDALRVSGTMRAILRVSTTAISVTQTFSFVGRIRGSAMPTVTLADSVGTPTLTTNTSAVF